jgi:hypothetical protein
MLRSPSTSADHEKIGDRCSNRLSRDQLVVTKVGCWVDFKAVPGAAGRETHVITSNQEIQGTRSTGAEGSQVRGYFGKQDLCSGVAAFGVAVVIGVGKNLGGEDLAADRVDAVLVPGDVFLKLGRTVRARQRQTD